MLMLLHANLIAQSRLFEIEEHFHINSLVQTDLILLVKLWVVRTAKNRVRTARTTATLNARVTVISVTNAACWMCVRCVKYVLTVFLDVVILWKCV